MKKLLIAGLLLLGLGAYAQKPYIPDTVTAGQLRVDEVMKLIDGNYTEAPDMDKMSEVAISAMFKALDPHSVYIAAKDVQRANEQLQGNFEGVGISFQIVDKTVVVQTVIEGGPSEKVGLMIGDKIISIDGINATGDSATNDFVFRHLRGKKGTTVVVNVDRQGMVYTFHIVRDKIPIYSIDTYFMADDSIGYIRLIRFARSSADEFRKALKALKKQGMTSLILDLRGNAGGYLDIACQLGNEFLERGQLIVYQEGRRTPRQNYTSNGRGNWRATRDAKGNIVGGRLVVLIDEGSASASEIVSGAVQDWDRGTIVGRRSFGKGLVQRMFPLKDGGQVRLTTARYFTPSGRCIQRSYDEGSDAYRQDVNNRYNNGELVSADSIHFADSLKYKTAHGRTVYGGGGIMPDIFVPIDHDKDLDAYYDIANSSALIQFAFHYTNEHKAELHKRFPDTKSYVSGMTVSDQMLQQLVSYYEKNNKKKVSKMSANSAKELKTWLKALIGRNLYGDEAFYPVINKTDPVINKALETLK